MRRKKIETEIRALTSRKGLHTHEDAGLLELVTYLNEYPSVILGSFDPAFLALPDEILHYSNARASEIFRAWRAATASSRRISWR